MKFLVADSLTKGKRFFCDFEGSPKGAFLVPKMKKITKFYIDKAKYRAEDNFGNITWVEINYWKNNFKMSKPDKKLRQVAKNLLEQKYRVNFASKLLK